MKISIICVGRLGEKFFRDACDEYIKRLSPHCKINIIELKDEQTKDGISAAAKEQILKKEGERILDKIQDDAHVITLEIAGKQYSSEEFASHIKELSLHSVSHIQFIIGGSLGLHEMVTKKAETHLSFSKMTFPHQLMRVVLLEQIYRAYRIISGAPYHK